MKLSIVESNKIYLISNMKSNIWYYNDAYILLNGDVTITAAPTTQVSFKIVHHLLNVPQKLMEQQ